MARDKQLGRLAMRTDAVLEAQLDHLAERFNISRSSVVRQAIARWAHAEGWQALPQREALPPPKHAAVA